MLHLSEIPLLFVLWTRGDIINNFYSYTPSFLSTFQVLCLPTVQCNLLPINCVLCRLVRDKCACKPNSVKLYTTSISVCSILYYIAYHNRKYTVCTIIYLSLKFTYIWLLITYCYLYIKSELKFPSTNVYELKLQI